MTDSASMYGPKLLVVLGYREDDLPLPDGPCSALWLSLSVLKSWLLTGLVHCIARRHADRLGW